MRKNNNKPSILFITPVRHLKLFYDTILERVNFDILDEPSYQSVFDAIHGDTDNTKYDVLFCAPNHQAFVIDDNLIGASDIKCILTPSTGTNHIRQNKVPVISIANDKILYDIRSTAEHSLFLMLSIARKVKPTIELSNKTLGIIGYGRLGKMTEILCKNLFKKIICTDKNSDYVNLFNESDVVSLHMDLNESSYQKVDKDFLSNFRKEIYLVNTSRGEVVNEIDVYNFLKEGKLKGYATDVLQSEHESHDSILYNECIRDKIIITPHVGGVTNDAQEKAYQRVLEKYENNSRALSKS